MKKLNQQPRIGVIDFFVGFVAAIAISDWLVQPLFNTDGKSYGIKILYWLIGTLIFLALGLGIMVLTMYLRSRLHTRRK
jgi:hypothetical protein